MLHCSIVSSLWEIIFTLVGVHWVFPKSVKEAIICWDGFFCGQEEKEDLEINSYVYFLDSLGFGRKETIKRLKMGSEIKEFFCLCYSMYHALTYWFVSYLDT